MAEQTPQENQIPSLENESSDQQQSPITPSENSMGACASASSSKSPTTISPAASQNLPQKSAQSKNPGAGMEDNTAQQAPSKPDVVPDAPDNPESQSQPPAQLDVQAVEKNYKEAATTPTHPAEKSLQTAMKDFEQTADDLEAEVSKAKADLSEKADTEVIPSSGENPDDSNLESSDETEQIADALASKIVDESISAAQEAGSLREPPETSGKPQDEEKSNTKEQKQEELKETEDAKPKQLTECESNEAMSDESLDQTQTKPAENIEQHLQVGEEEVPDAKVENNADSLQEQATAPENENEALEESTQDNKKEASDQVKEEGIKPDETSELHQEAATAALVDEESSTAAVDEETVQDVGDGSTSPKQAEQQEAAVPSQQADAEVSSKEEEENVPSTHELYNYLLKLQQEMSSMQLQMIKLQENMRSTSNVLEMVIGASEKQLGI